jgi:uncharacterized repeat protein (TIGR01451 family)
MAGPDGGASYNISNRRVSWSGDLAPGAAVTFTYRLSVTGGTAYSTLNNTADVTLGELGLHFQRHVSVRIAAPGLAASSLTLSQGDAAPQPATVGASAEVWVTLALRNDGLVDAPNVRVDNPLPWPFHLITGTYSSGGVGLWNELPGENRILWEGIVGVSAPVTLTYRAVAPAVLEAATWVYNAANLEDGLGGVWERGGWLYVEPLRFYLPVFSKTS